MGKQSIWTEDLDSRVLSLRAAGLPWDSIALALELGRTQVRERGRRLGAFRMPIRRETVPETAERLPLPPGHPFCWGLLTDGTVLDGEAYPFPVFL